MPDYAGRHRADEIEPDQRLPGEEEDDFTERVDETFRGTGLKGYVNRLYRGLRAAEGDPVKRGRTGVPGGEHTATACPPEMEPIVRFVIDKYQVFPRQYRHETYVERIVEHADSPEHAAILQRSLLLLEADWRAEMVAHDASVKTLGIATDSRSNSLTWREPQPDIFCGFTHRNGGRCTEMVVPGSHRCVRHGGALVDPDTRRSYLLSAYASIVEGAEDAVEALIWVAKNGRNELARVAAAKEILDRAGLTPTLNVNLTVSQGGEQVAALQEKLDAIQKNLTSRAIDVGSAVRDPDDVEHTDVASDGGAGAVSESSEPGEPGEPGDDD